MSICLLKDEESVEEKERKAKYSADFEPTASGLLRDCSAIYLPLPLDL